LIHPVFDFHAFSNMNAKFPDGPLTSSQLAAKNSHADAARSSGTIDKALIETLRDGDFHGRWEALKQITKSAESVIPELLALLADDRLDQEGQWFVVQALGAFDQPQVVSALVNRFGTTEDEDLRMAIGEALGQIGQNAVLALSGLVQNPQHRLVAVQALVHIRHPATIQPLLQVVEDPDATVRAIALQGLVAHHHPDLLPVLVNALEDTAAQVRLVALQGIVGLRQQVSAAQLLQWLTPRLWDININVAQRAAHSLGRLPLAAATTTLLTVLQTTSPPEPLQIAAIQALGWQATPEALTGLMSLWHHASMPARLAIIRALEQFTEPDLKRRASQRMQTWLQQLPRDASTIPLRRDLLLAVGTLGDIAGEEMLRSHLADPDPSVCLHARAALAKLIDTAHY
jgi:HEAT repeat protein